MKKDMIECVKELSSDFEILENIIYNQYRKFINFYRLIENYSDLIDSMTYSSNSNDSLDVSLSLNTKKDMKSIKKELDKYMSEHEYNGEIEVNKKTIYISLIMEENI